MLARGNHNVVLSVRLSNVLTQVSSLLQLHDVLSQFALYLLDIFDEQNNLHALLVQDLTKFVISLMRTKSLPRNTIGQTRFRHFGQKMSAKVKYSAKFNYLDYLYTL